MKTMKIGLFFFGFISVINYVHASNESTSADLLELQRVQMMVDKELSQDLLAFNNKEVQMTVDKELSQDLLAFNNKRKYIEINPSRSLNRKSHLQRSPQEMKDDLALCKSLGSNATTYSEQQVLFGREIRQGREGGLTASALRIGLAYNEKQAKIKNSGKAATVLKQISNGGQVHVKINRTPEDLQRDSLLCQFLGSNETTYKAQQIVFGREIREGREGGLTPSALRIGLAYNETNAQIKEKRKVATILKQMSNGGQIHVKINRTKQEMKDDLALCKSLGSDATIYEEQKVVFGREIREGRRDGLTPSALRIGLTHNHKEEKIKEIRKAVTVLNQISNDKQVHAK